jgi:hypothetical protein
MSHSGEAEVSAIAEVVTEPTPILVDIQVEMLRESCRTLALQSCLSQPTVNTSTLHVFERFTTTITQPVDCKRTVRDVRPLVVAFLVESHRAVFDVIQRSAEAAREVRNASEIVRFAMSVLAFYKPYDKQTHFTLSSLPSAVLPVLYSA